MANPYTHVRDWRPLGSPTVGDRVVGLASAGYASALPVLRLNPVGPGDSLMARRCPTFSATLLHLH